VNVKPDFDAGLFGRAGITLMPGAVGPAAGSFGMKLIGMAILLREIKI
jgi:hypothetical protein